MPRELVSEFSFALVNTLRCTWLGMVHGGLSTQDLTGRARHRVTLSQVKAGSDCPLSTSRVSGVDVHSGQSVTVGPLWTVAPSLVDGPQCPPWLSTVDRNELSVPPGGSRRVPVALPCPLWTVVCRSDVRRVVVRRVAPDMTLTCGYVECDPRHWERFGEFLILRQSRVDHASDLRICGQVAILL